MKIKIVIFIVILLIIVGLFIILNKKKVDNVDIKSFNFGYSVSTMMNGYVRYNIDCNNTCKAIIKLNGVAEEDAVEVKIDNKDLEELKNIIEKFNISSWDGFNKVDKNVLDGNDFNISICMKNGDSISASGYMKWPKNYSEFRSEIDTYFNNLLERGGE